MSAWTILIVDDEAQLRMNLRALLEDLGYNVQEASDGIEGLAQAQALKPDLVLLDIRMPGIDGFEVCIQLKAQPELQGTPVIFLSGMLDVQDKVKAFSAGGVDYITKPFHLDEVEARVRTHLALRDQHRQIERQNESLERTLKESQVLNRKLVEINERLKQSEEAKGRFLALMRNEMNNPLNSILGLGVELEQGQPSPLQCQSLGRMIAAEAAALDFQIRNIFWAAELEAGDMAPHPASVDVGSVIRDALDSLRYQAQEKGIQVQLHLEGLPTAYGMDPNMLWALVANLASNAIKFSAEGRPVQLRSAIREGCLNLEIEDQGEGFSAADQKRIFEPFRQLESGASRSHQGHGLGLSIVHALVELLNGRLQVQSQPGQGSTFALQLPEQEIHEASSTSNLAGNLFFFDATEEA